MIFQKQFFPFDRESVYLRQLQQLKMVYGPTESDYCSLAFAKDYVTRFLRVYRRSLSRDAETQTEVGQQKDSSVQTDGQFQANVEFTANTSNEKQTVENARALNDQANHNDDDAGFHVNVTDVNIIVNYMDM